jgi:hypothetical protein
MKKYQNEKLHPIIMNSGGVHVEVCKKKLNDVEVCIDGGFGAQGV